MACIWCQDEELALKTLKMLVNFVDMTSDNLKRAIQDLYHCADCVNVYYRLKANHMKDDFDCNQLAKLEAVRIKDHLTKINQTSDEIITSSSDDDIDELFIPVIEILKHPVILLSKEDILQRLEEVLCWMVQNKENVKELNHDLNDAYPGLFILLLNKQTEVRQWASSFLSRLPMIKIDQFHCYSSILDCILNLWSFEKSSNAPSLSAFPERLPEYIFYNENKGAVLEAFSQILKVIESRVLKILLSKHSNRSFISTIFKNMKDSPDLFWSGLQLTEILLTKLGSSFWLLSNEFTKPSDLFQFFTLHSKFQESKRYAKFAEYKFNNSNDLIEQFGMEHNVSKMYVRCQNPNLYSWIFPYLKSVVDFDEHLGNIMPEIMDILTKIESDSSTELFVSSTSCLLEILQYVCGTGRLSILHNYRSYISNALLEIMKQNHYDILKNICRRIVSELTARFKGFKQIDDQDYLDFQSNWKKLDKNVEYDSEIVKKTLLKVLKFHVPVKVESVEEDDKRVIQEQIRLIQNVGSTDSPIVIDESDDEVALDKSSEFICIVDISEEEDTTDDGNLMQNSSQSPKQLNEMDDTEVHFFVEDDSINDDSESKAKKLKLSTEDEIKSDIQPKKSSKINFSSLKEKLSLSSLRNKLQKNQVNRINNLESSKDKTDTIESPVQSAVLHQTSNSHKTILQNYNVADMHCEKSKQNSNFLCENNLDSIENADLYQNKVYDIGSTFQNEAKKIPEIKKPPAVKLRQSLRRERIEQGLGMPVKSALSRQRSKSTQSMKPISLPEMTSKHSYTIDLFQDSILAWKPVWLEEEKDELELKTKFQGVSFSYNSYDEYMKTYWPLMLLETWSQLRRDWKENNYIHHICFIDSIDETSNIRTRLVRCTLLIKKNVHDPSYDHQSLVQDDLLFLSFSKDLKLFGLVESVFVEKNVSCNNKNENCTMYSLGILIKNDLNVGASNHLRVTKITSLTTVLRQWKGILGFQSSLLAKDILKPFRNNTFTMKEDLLKRTDRLRKLNPDQFQAVSSVSKAVKSEYAIPRICLIQGPPGTGKSYTVKIIVTHLLQAIAEEQTRLPSKKSNILNCNRILICAPSNAAVDEIAKRLLNSPPRLSPSMAKNKENVSVKNCGDFNLVRIGRKSQVDRGIYPYTLEYILEREMRNFNFLTDPVAIQKEMKRIRQDLEKLDHCCVKLKMTSDPVKSAEYEAKNKEREQLQQKHDELLKKLEKATNANRDVHQERKRLAQNILLRADVILSTLSGAGSDWMVKTFKETENRRIAFRCVIIDEAGQCTEPDALIPLQYGSSKLVLVGDQCQLPATVFSQKAIRYNFDRSMFERIIKALTKHKQMSNESYQGDRVPLMLSTQYRMVKEICLFPSKRFYDNNLRPAKVMNESWPLKPYMVIDLKGREKKLSSGALHNPIECQFVLDLCKIIVHDNNMQEHTIGIITPYKQQALFVQEKLKQNNLQMIKVNTIDSYQGQEREVIIISCVRGPNKRKTIGFLCDPQRMNVALTRAKKTLIVLANKDAIEIDEDWKKLFEDAASRKVLHSVELASELNINTSTLGFPSSSSSSKKSNSDVINNNGSKKLLQPSEDNDNITVLDEKACNENIIEQSEFQFEIEKDVPFVDVLRKNVEIKIESYNTTKDQLKINQNFEEKHQPLSQQHTHQSECRAHQPKECQEKQSEIQYQKEEHMSLNRYNHSEQYPSQQQKPWQKLDKANAFNNTSSKEQLLKNDNNNTMDPSIDKADMTTIQVKVEPNYLLERLDTHMSDGNEQNSVTKGIRPMERETADEITKITKEKVTLNNLNDSNASNESKPVVNVLPTLSAVQENSQRNEYFPAEVSLNYEFLDTKYEIISPEIEMEGDEEIPLVKNNSRKELTIEVRSNPADSIEFIGTNSTHVKQKSMHTEVLRDNDLQETLKSSHNAPKSDISNNNESLSENKDNHTNCIVFDKEVMKSNEKPLSNDISIVPKSTLDQCLHKSTDNCTQTRISEVEERVDNPNIMEKCDEKENSSPVLISNSTAKESTNKIERQEKFEPSSITASMKLYLNKDLESGEPERFKSETITETPIIIETTTNKEASKCEKEDRKDNGDESSDEWTSYVDNELEKHVNKQFEKLKSVDTTETKNLDVNGSSRKKAIEDFLNKFIQQKNSKSDSLKTINCKRQTSMNDWINATKDGKTCETCDCNSAECQKWNCIKQRRSAPSKAYFNFPHRHIDGTWCKTVCSRVLEREQKRGCSNMEVDSLSQSTKKLPFSNSTNIEAPSLLLVTSENSLTSEKQPSTDFTQKSSRVSDPRIKPSNVTRVSTAQSKEQTKPNLCEATLNTTKPDSRATKDFHELFETVPFLESPPNNPQTNNQRSSPQLPTIKSSHKRNSQDKSNHLYVNNSTEKQFTCKDQYFSDCRPVTTSYPAIPPQPPDPAIPPQPPDPAIPPQPPDPAIPPQPPDPAIPPQPPDPAIPPQPPDPAILPQPLELAIPHLHPESAMEWEALAQTPIETRDLTTQIENPEHSNSEFRTNFSQHPSLSYQDYHEHERYITQTNNNQYISSCTFTSYNYEQNEKHNVLPDLHQQSYFSENNFKNFRQSYPSDERNFNPSVEFCESYTSYSLDKDNYSFNQKDRRDSDCQKKHLHNIMNEALLKVMNSMRQMNSTTVSEPVQKKRRQFPEESERNFSKMKNTQIKGNLNNINDVKERHLNDRHMKLKEKKVSRRRRKKAPKRKEVTKEECTKSGEVKDKKHSVKKKKQNDKIEKKYFHIPLVKPISPLNNVQQNKSTAGILPETIKYSEEISNKVGHSKSVNDTTDRVNVFVKPEFKTLDDDNKIQNSDLNFVSAPQCIVRRDLRELLNRKVSEDYKETQDSDRNFEPAPQRIVRIDLVKDLREHLDRKRRKGF